MTDHNPCKHGYDEGMCGECYPRDNRLPVDHTRCYQGELTGMWYSDFGRVCHRLDIHEPSTATKTHTLTFSDQEMRAMLLQHGRGLGLTEADIDAMVGAVRPAPEPFYGPARTHALILELESYSRIEEKNGYPDRASRYKRSADALTSLSLRLGGDYSRMAERATEPEEKPSIALPARDPEAIDYGTPGQADFNKEAYIAEGDRIAAKSRGARDPRPPMGGPETDGYTGYMPALRGDDTINFLASTNEASTRYLRDDSPEVQALRERINIPKDLS